MRKVLLLFVFALATFMARSQSSGIGFKAGATMSTLSGDDTDDFESRVSYQAGVKANIPAGTKFFVSPEILWMNVGPKTGSHLSLNYISLAPLFAYMITNSLFLSTGPQLGILASAKHKSDGEEYDVKENFNSTSFAWVLALEYMLKSGFGFNAQYNLGLSNIHKDGDYALRNQVFALSLVYMFMMNKK